jgi:quercetin dioxygenase-like cupin family protein
MRTESPVTLHGNAGDKPSYAHRKWPFVPWRTYSAARRETMGVVRISDVEAREVTGSYFKGKVSIQGIIGESEDEFRVVVVNFSPGAASVFHTHSVDHVLYVTSGTGMVATEDEEITVTPGTVIHIPAGERHRHGAAGEAAASQIAIMPPGETSF